MNPGWQEVPPPGPGYSAPAPPFPPPRPAPSVRGVDVVVGLLGSLAGGYGAASLLFPVGDLFGSVVVALFVLLAAFTAAIAVLAAVASRRRRSGFAIGLWIGGGLWILFGTVCGGLILAFSGIR